MLVGLFVCCVGVYGVFKLKYAANRMHAAALNDTLGVSFCLIGLAISAAGFLHGAENSAGGRVSVAGLPGGEPSALPP